MPEVSILFQNVVFEIIPNLLIEYNTYLVKIILTL